MKRIAHGLALVDPVTTRMKIDQPLTPDLAEKWKRLLASQGGDPESLALAAVELLWKKYGKDVEKFERGDLAYRKKLAAEYVRTVRPAKRKGALSPCDKITEEGLVRYLAEDAK